MSEYRVCIVGTEKHKLISARKFDNKEDAEHFAKNSSVADHKHRYEVQKNDKGDFAIIKAYQNGQEV